MAAGGVLSLTKFKLLFGRQELLSILVGWAVLGGWFAWFIWTSNPILHCGWDGSQYCLMFRNEPAMEPYSRRIFPPYIASFFDDEPIPAFLKMNTLSIFGVVSIGSYLISRYGKNLWKVALISAGFSLAVSTSRNTFHHFVNAPVLTDYVSLLLLFVFLLGVHFSLTGVRGSLHLLTFPLLLFSSGLATLSREAYGPALLVVSFALLFVRDARIPAIGGLLGSSASTLFVLTTSSAGSSGETIRFWVSQFFGSFSGFGTFSVMLLVGLGLLPLIFSVSIYRQRVESFTIVMLIFGFVYFGISVFGGGNLDRILLPVAVVMVLALALQSRTNLQVWAFVMTVLGYVIAQYPSFVIQSGDSKFLGFIDFWHSSSPEEVVSYGLIPFLLGIPFSITALVLLIMQQRKQSRAMIKFDTSNSFYTRKILD